MKNSFAGFVLMGTVLSSGIQLPAQTPENNPDRVTATWSDTGKPGLLKVNILGGGMTIRTHAGNDVIIEGKPGRDRRPAPPEAAGMRRVYSNTASLTVQEENNVMTVTTGWAVSANLDIQVPVKTNLNVQTVNGGSIVIEGVEGEIEATNLNGAVILNNVAGSVVAHSMNGKVVASLRQVTADKPMALTSMNGTIDVTLPSSLKANLKMRTDNGEVYSDFDIQLGPSQAQSFPNPGNRRGNRIEVGKTIAGTVNGGGPVLDLRTFNGNIYIRKPKP